jgi:RND family efflux transporter MFP subunit
MNIPSQFPVALRFHRSAALCLGLAALLLTSSGCDAPAVVPPEPPRPVFTHRVKKPQPTVKRSFSGMVRALDGVELAFEVGGRMIEIIAEEGRIYSAGTELARLDDTGYRADFNNAQAHYAAAEADLQRTLRLYENANASKSQLDGAMVARETAKANRSIANKRLTDSVLRMPYDGIVGRVVANKHSVVSTGDTVVSIRGEVGLQMEIGVPATVIDQIEVGMRASVRLGSLPHLSETAVVGQVSPQISDNTTYLVTLDFEDPSKEILEGMDGEATLELPNPAGDTITVPLVCVAGGGDEGAYVWVVKPFAADGEAAGEAVLKRRTVTLGQLRDENHIEIATGLTTDEIIVSRGVHRVEDGQRVLSDAAHTN